jgi:esterase/lipase
MDNLRKQNIIRNVILLGIGILAGFILANRNQIPHYFELSSKEKNNNWQPFFTLVEIPGSIDNKKQMAFMYPTKQKEKMPLVVSLHTWSGDYRQYDDLAVLVKNADWNYIHPDFRGKNNTPESCLSELAIGDIDNAILFAAQNGNVDLNNIFVLGHSGGGMAVLGMFLKSSYNIKYCMSWCPVSDLELWYNQSRFSNTEYWQDILKVGGSGKILNIEEIRKRSPLYMQPKKNINTLLEIYAGINDGYNGTVSTLHSINFYNKYTSYQNKQNYAIPDNDIISLISRNFSDGQTEFIAGRRIIYKKEAADINLFIFDGGHEMLTEYAFNRLTEIFNGNTN